MVHDVKLCWANKTDLMFYNKGFISTGDDEDTSLQPFEKADFVPINFLKHSLLRKKKKKIT